MSDQMTHCGHGISYKDECNECDKLWADMVQLRSARKAVADLLRFYDKDSLIELIFAQDHHIEKLQAKLPPLKDAQPHNPRKG